MDKDERDSRKERNGKRNRRGRGDKGTGTGRSVSRGGIDPRDAEVRALSKQVAALQKKTSVKAPEAPAANDDSSTPSDSELSELESVMGPSHPATFLLRTQLEEAKKERDDSKPLLEIQALEKRLKKRQRAVEAATAKRDQLQHSLQAARRPALQIRVRG